MSRKVRQITNINIDDPKILEFINAQSPKTAKTYVCNFRKVLEFTKGESGAKMIQDCELWSRRIFAFQNYLKTQGYSGKYVQACIGALRGFFSYYKSTLDLSDQEKVKLNKTSRNSEDYTFTQATLRRLVHGDLKSLYVTFFGASIGLRSEDFCRITFGALRLAIYQAKENGIAAPIPMGKMNTEKEGVDAHLFISSDALQIVQTILEGHKDTKDSDRVFNERPTQLTTILQNHCRKCGIENFEARIRFHCLRKFLYSAVSSVSSEQNAKLIIGKKVSGADSVYLDVNALREIYERAQARICVMNGANGEIRAKVEEQNGKIAQLEAKIEELKAQKAQVEVSASQLKIQEILDRNPNLIEELIKIAKQPKQT